MSQFIDLDKAKKMTALYRAEKDNILIESERGKNIMPVCETIDLDKLNLILSQPGCRGIRIYYGMDDNKLLHSIIVGTDESGKDILPGTETEAEESYILNEAQRCPTFCPPSSPLYP